MHTFDNPRVCPFSPPPSQISCPDRRRPIVHNDLALLLHPLFFSLNLTQSLHLRETATRPHSFRTLTSHSRSRALVLALAPSSITTTRLVHWSLRARAEKPSSLVVDHNLCSPPITVSLLSHFPLTLPTFSLGLIFPQIGPSL